LRLALRWSLFAALLLAFVLVPFVLLEDPMNAVVQNTLQSPHSLAFITLVVIAFLLADIALPIPSSFVLASTGFLLGLGTLVGFIGLSCTSLAGYPIGRWAGEPLAQRIVGGEQLARVSAWSRRHGDALLVAFRAMPVLAEATTILAGTARMALPRFVVLVSIGNAVVAALYACIGAWSASRASFVWVSLAAMALPVLIVLVMRQVMPHAAASAPRQP
jgi:uncharacterized membrane protein YdjX (TVP38/TMEM64 family)